MSYQNMTRVPAFGNAKTVGAPMRENFSTGRQVPGLAAGQVMQQECAFPAAPPPRVYCQPAAFTSVDGRHHHLLVNAYGNSRPSF